jgi:quercetin dioxygenase-like cupin family protein
MNPYTYIPDVADAIIPVTGGSSRTIHQDDHSRVVVFAFATGHDLPAHAASLPAFLCVLRGEALVQLGDDRQLARSGAFIYMTAGLSHAVHANTDLVFLLFMLKPGKQ